LPPTGDRQYQRENGYPAAKKTIGVVDPPPESEFKALPREAREADVIIFLVISGGGFVWCWCFSRSDRIVLGVLGGGVGICSLQMAFMALRTLG
jgi:hypothetical protein